MRRYLLNSAVMAAGSFGVYRYTEASAEELAEFLASKPYISRVGYPETAAFVERVTGIRPPLSRAPSPMDAGDVAMVVRLRYRVGNARRKAQQKPTDQDWEIALLERIE